MRSPTFLIECFVCSFLGILAPHWCLLLPVLGLSFRVYHGPVPPSKPRGGLCRRSARRTHIRQAEPLSRAQRAPYPRSVRLGRKRKESWHSPLQSARNLIVEGNRPSTDS